MTSFQTIEVGNERILDQLRQRDGLIDSGVLSTPDERWREIDVEPLLLFGPLALHARMLVS
jgi:hypothetical protein